MSKLRILTAASGLALAVPALGAGGFDQQQTSIRAGDGAATLTSSAPLAEGRFAPTAAGAAGPSWMADPPASTNARPPADAAAGPTPRQRMQQEKDEQFLRDTWTNG